MAIASGFDVAVVGSGAAGCVVAARLAETASRSVLLLEAGPDLRRLPPADLHDGWNIAPGVDWGHRAEADDRGAVEEVAVVDASGGVHGVDGLSVIDASIIPDAPSGFPHIITIMIAERLAEQINGPG